MNRAKEFRRKCEEAETPWKRVAFLYDFIEADYALDEPTSSFYTRRRKSNTQIVIEELERYISKYKDFYIFCALVDSPNISSKEDMQMLFELYAKWINKINDGKLDKNTITVAEKFTGILDIKNFTTIYKMFDKSAKESIVIINNLIEQLKHSYDNGETLESEKDIIRKNINQERLKISNELLDPFFSLIHAISEDDRLKNNGEATERTHEIYDTIVENLSELYEYVSKFELPIQIYFEDPRDTKKPRDCINLYEFFMEINILPFMNIEKCEKTNFQSLVTGIKNNFIPNISWTKEDYKILLDRCQEKESDIPLAFLLIDKYRGNDNELDELFNEFLTKNKEHFLLWCMCGESEYFDYNFSNKSVYTDNDVLAYRMIVDELLKRQNDRDIRYIDLECYRTGSTSTVTKVGEYVVKCGHGRYVDTIPNHRRILQPIIRRRNEEAFFEVTDVADNDVTQEELEQVYYEMLQDGIAWVDPGLANIGRLKRRNVPRHNIDKAVRTEDGITYLSDTSSSSEVATNIIGEACNEPLDKGECVIIDSDLVFDLRDMTREQFDNLAYPPYMTQEMIYKLRKRFEEIQVEKRNSNRSTSNDCCG